MNVTRAICICALIGAWATPVLADPISPQEAAAHVGQVVTIEGVVSVYASRSGVVFVDMGGAGREAPFSAVILQDRVAAFPAIQAMNGKVVDVTGLIELFKGKPEIVLKSADQIRAK